MQSKSRARLKARRIRILVDLEDQIKRMNAPMHPMYGTRDKHIALLLQMKTELKKLIEESND